MPRDGTQTYILPFPDVVADTTIESPVYNGFTNDVAQDLNNPRPIVAGGTGAASADAALTNLSAEKASQTVTNYDSMVWISGSFSSATSATNPPVAGHAFSGIVYVTDVNNIVVEARDVADNKLYLRRKTASVWGAWTALAGPGADLDAAYVNVSGDTMTGHLSLPITPAAANAVRKDYVDTADALKVAKAGDAMTGNLSITGTSNVSLTLNSLAASGSDILGQKNGNTVWYMRLGNDVAMGGANAGANFDIYRATDSGSLINVVFSIDRAVGTTFITTGNDSVLSLQVGGTSASPRIQMWGDRGAGIGSNIHFNTGNGGSLTTGNGVPIHMGGLALNVYQNSGVNVGSPTGGDKGIGTLNANAVYDDNVLLTCMAVEHAKYGKVDLAKWDAVSPTGRHKMAHDFVDTLSTFDPRDPAQYIKKMLGDEALPGMPSSKDWKHGELSTGEMITRLWLAVEMLATAFATTHLDKLEKK